MHASWVATQSVFSEDRPIRVDVNTKSLISFHEENACIYLFWEIPKEVIVRKEESYEIECIQSSINPEDILYIIPREATSFIRVQLNKTSSSWWYITTWKDPKTDAWILRVLSQEEFRNQGLSKR
ncbi:MAG: hypothetical protein EOM19_00940 [Candidatus Moranbacteria bacterium]|nr:hypothetical protein [Candidatus Moranbacteria bacterium]